MGRTALVLSGGGAKGAFELGAIDYLVRDQGLEFDILVGVSTGCLNAAMLAQGKGRQGLLDQLEILKEIWFSIRSVQDIFTHRLLGWVGIALGAKSLYYPKGLIGKINLYVNPEDLRSSGRMLKIGVISLTTGEYLSVTQDHPSIKDMILASATIPLSFPPVSWNGQRWVDGGVRNITPLADAFDAFEEADRKWGKTDGDDRMIVVLASPLSMTPADHLNTGIEIGFRALDILTNEIYLNDLSTATKINQAVRAQQSLRSRLAREIGDNRAANLMAGTDDPFAGHRWADLTVIEPDQSYLKTMEFDPTKIQIAFEAGRKAAASIFETPEETKS